MGDTFNFHNTGPIEFVGEAPAGTPKCDHGEPMVRETPSAFKGADPVRVYADGCQSYGPYAGEADK